MRAIRLRFQCFGPYIEEQIVSFERFEQKRLFLICGETGSGKTTILDAMCYALYGKSSGDLRGKLEIMRCQSAPCEKDTIVEFIFESEGERYCFIRTLHYGKKNRKDFHNCMIEQDGVWTPLLENPKEKAVNQKAEEILGLTSEQFRQVIILPQGQFEKLLVSNSDEKEKILVSLFHAEKWQVMAEELYRRVFLEDKQLKQEIEEMENQLKAYQCDTVEDLALSLQGKKEALKGIYQALEDAQKEEERQRESYQKSLRIADEFREKERRQRYFDALMKKKKSVDKQKKILQRAETADRIKPDYERYQEAKKEKIGYENRIREGEKRQREAQVNWEDVVKQQETLEKRRKEYLEQLQTLTRLEQRRAIYAVLDEKKQAVLEANSYESQKEEEWKTAERYFQCCREQSFFVRKERENSIRDFIQTQELYLRGINQVLAENLKEGLPCPVCGSLHHPMPANQESQGQTYTPYVREEELKQSREKMEATIELVKQAEMHEKEAEKQKQTAWEQVQRAKERTMEANFAQETILKQREQGIDTLEELELVCGKLRNSIEEYRIEEQKIQAKIIENQGIKEGIKLELEQLKTMLIQAEEKLQEKEKQWSNLLEKYHFVSEKEYQRIAISEQEQQKLRAQIMQYSMNVLGAEQALREQEKKLEGEEIPDIERQRKALKETELMQKKRMETWILQQENCKRQEELWLSMVEKRKIYEKKRKRIDENLEFARKLRGNSGISLQRYVLGVMLHSITVEANRLLQNVHQGRYQLYRTDGVAGSSRKSGLELEVLDRRVNERRSVTTLSGGEKFLVALSLAIGLSTVVQAQGNGIRLGAMFIDEGFGSLDQNSIFDALEVLQGLQRANGVVGIISHVELLKQTVSEQIEVIKKEEGSSIK